MLIFPRERGTFPEQSGKIRGRSDGRREPWKTPLASVLEAPFKTPVSP